MPNTREKLIELILSAMPPCYSDVFATQIADHLIANDVVSVVRCEDCKHHYENDDFICIGVKDDDFCSYGERREGE